MRTIALTISLILAFSANSQILIGDTLPTIALKDQKDQVISISAFKGKTVLLDFWASWCGPCRVANKKLVRLYKDQKAKNFEIVGISLDTDRNKWLNAITKDKLEHTQLTDPKGFDAQSAVTFGVDGLPAAYLFDRSGKLVAINPTEEQILNEINK